MKTIFVAALVLLLATPLVAADKINVLCIGDSITFGTGSSDPETKSYPVQLQAQLGDGYTVEKYGVGSCAVIRKGRPVTI